MLKFEAMAPETWEQLAPFFRREHFTACTQSFQTVYLWSSVYDTRYALCDGWLFFRSEKNGHYAFPFGEGDPTHALELLREDAHTRGEKLRFFGLLAEQKKWLEQHYPGQFKYVNDRDGAEYLYEAEKLTTYAGKKLHAKRNFTNRFEAAHPDWRFEPITTENIPAVEEMHRRWVLENENAGEEGLHQEGCVVRRCLREWDKLGMTGGVLWARDTVMGFSVASMISDTVADINIEKAESEEPGAYPMVCREMVKLLLAQYPDLRYINREEDTGDEGLRRSKESYNPVMLLEKYYTEEL